MIQVLNLDPLEFRCSGSARFRGRHYWRFAHSVLDEVETGCTGFLPNANDTTAYSQAAPTAREATEITASAGLPAETRCMYPRIYNDTEKAELGYA